MSESKGLRIGTPAQWLSRLPGPRTPRWPEGERFVEVFERADIIIEFYAPQGRDPQKPHDRDEVYFVISGSGYFTVAGESSPFAAGDALFVAAGVEHRFENFTQDFATWVVFFGPKVGK